MAGKHISIPALLKIGAGALDNLGIYLKELQLQKVVVLFGNGLVEMFGSTVMEALQQEDIDILEYQELDTVRLEDLTSLAFSMPAKTQAVIGIGGGKVIDGAKYCGFCEICRLSASQHRHRAMAFQVPVLPFWWRGGASPFRQNLHMGLWWIQRLSAVHRRNFYIPESAIWYQKLRHCMTGFLRKNMGTEKSMILLS